MTAEPCTDADRDDGIHIGKRTNGVWTVQHGTNVMAGGVCIATCGGRQASHDPERTRIVEENLANAEFICRAVNSHDDLLAAACAALEPLELYHAYGWPDRAGVIERLRAVIEKAGTE